MAQAQKDTERRMAFFDHVDELRLRFMKALYAFMGGFVFCYFVSNEFVLEWLRKPLFQALPPAQQKLYFTHLFENFLVHLKIAGYSSVALISPFLFYQIWAFIAPGLRPMERKMVIPFITATAGFFIAGAGFAYYVLFPVGFKYFVSYGGPSDVALLTIDGYYSTCLKLMLLFGASFEMPVLITFLGFLGVIDAAFLRKNRRTAILIITALSALFAPPDAISMLILMGPLILMYEAAIWVVQWLQVKRAAQTTEDSSENPLVGRSRP